MGNSLPRPLTKAKRAKIATAAAKILQEHNIRQMERRYQVLQMRRDGHNLKDIADALHIGVVQVRADLVFVLSLTAREMMETSEEQRQLQNERLDVLLKTYIPLATNTHNEVLVDKQTGQESIVTMPPDPKMAQVVLSTMQRQAKLNALDVPEVKKLDVTGIREYVGVDIESV